MEHTLRPPVATLTPAEQHRIKALRVTPNLLDNLDAPAPCVCVENCLPNDAVVCGLYFDMLYGDYKVLIASASYDVKPMNVVVEVLPAPIFQRDESITTQCPFMQQLAAFVQRAKASIGAHTFLKDVVILPAYYVESITP